MKKLTLLAAALFVSAGIQSHAIPTWSDPTDEFGNVIAVNPAIDPHVRLRYEQDNWKFRLVEVFVPLTVRAGTSYLLLIDGTLINKIPHPVGYNGMRANISLDPAFPFSPGTHLLSITPGDGQPVEFDEHDNPTGNIFALYTTFSISAPTGLPPAVLAPDTGSTAALALAALAPLLLFRRRH